MSAPNLTSHPPHHHHAPPTPITPAQALADISTYLADAAAQAHLHPDAIFTEHGPAASQHAAEGGLILQLLRRVERGLQGERITARLPTTLEDDTDAIVDKSYNEQMLEQGGDEGVVEGEIGERHAPAEDETVAAAAAGPPAQGTKRKLDMVEPGADLASMSKEERKRYKKALHKQEQQAKNAAREAAAHAFQQADEGDVVMEDAHDKDVDPKLAKKEQRKRDREAKQRAQAQVEGQIPPSQDDDDDERAQAVLRPEERGRVEVVDRLGRDAADAVDAPVKEKKKKAKAKANGVANGAEGTKKRKKVDKERDVGL